MSAGKMYYQLNNKQNVPGWRLIKTLLLSSVLLLSFKAMAADVSPVFTNGSPQSITVCANSGATSINNLLTINAIATGQTETWSVAAAPEHGVLIGFDAVEPTDDSALTPTSLFYQPATGYSGTDSFTVQVSDGILSTTTTIIVTISPLPTFISPLTGSAICDGATFNYTPSSSTPGATFTWSRPIVGGIATPASSGVGSIHEALSSVTYYDVTATYNYTISAAGCSNTAHVAVVVHPTPRLAGSLFDTVCNGTLFTDSVYSNTAGTIISWSRSEVAGISPATASGTGNISETLTNSGSAAENTIYIFNLSANGCTATRELTVTVAPPVPVTAITTTSPASVCSNTLYQNFGAAAASAGVSYTWSANNATIYAEGAGNQYILVNFTNPGDALVTLTANVPGTSCYSKDSFAVAVGTGIASSAGIIYTGTQFVYLNNTATAYQWGYDNKVSLDSTLIEGAAFQSYPTTSPDFTDNIYWVMTTEDGCTAKTYYNASLSTASVLSANATAIEVYPNPSGNTVNIKIDGLQAGSNTIAVMNMLGATVKTTTTTQTTAQFNMADMPVGCYLVICYKDGVKVATNNFIKN